MALSRAQKKQAAAQKAAATKHHKRAAKARLLGDQHEVIDALNTSLTPRVKARTEANFVRILTFLSHYTSEILKIDVEEAEKRLLTAKVSIGVLRQGFAAYALLGGGGRLSALINGSSTGVNGGYGLEKLDPSEQARADRMARMLHVARHHQRPGSHVADEELIKDLPRPGPDDRPMTFEGLIGVVKAFFSGVRRRAQAAYDPSTMAGDVSSSSSSKKSSSTPYADNEPYQTTCWARLLENQGLLTMAKRRKHILTPAEIEAVLATLWRVQVPTIERICMLFVVTLLEATGLRPGELFRYDHYTDERPSEERTSAFLWSDVKLIYCGRYVCARTQRTGDADDGAGPSTPRTALSTEPRFRLEIEWKFGKGRMAGEIIPTSITSQKAETSHHCAVRWILVLAQWLDVFEPQTDKAIRDMVYDPSSTALAPNTLLRIKKAWKDVPVLLADRSSFYDQDTKLNNAHNMRLVAMSSRDAATCLQQIAKLLGWDSLAPYDFRRTFATLAKNSVSQEQLRLLMGHRHANSRVVETVYLADHVPIDQAAFAAGGRNIDQLYSKEAREAAGRSFGIAAPAASTTVLANPHVAKSLPVVRKLREAVMSDQLLACKVPRLAIDLINDDGWKEHLSSEQVSLVERLQEAETDFLSAYGWATGHVANPTHATVASSSSLTLVPSAPLGAKGGGQLSSSSASLAAAAAAERGPPTPPTPPTPSTSPAASDATDDTLSSDPSCANYFSADDITGQQWINELLQVNRSPVENMTHAEFFNFVGSYLAVAETERQGLCAICLDREPRDEVEASYAEMGDYQNSATCSERGLCNAGLPKAQRYEALILFHRHRQVPVIGLDAAQLRKLYRHAVKDKPKAQAMTASAATMSRWQLIEAVVGMYGSRCAPNGILNDASDWDVAAPTAPTPLGDGTNVAPASSSSSSSVGAIANRAAVAASTSAAARRYSWEAGADTTRYEASRAALRAGVNLRKESPKPYADMKTGVIADLIAKAMAKPGWAPSDVSPRTGQYTPPAPTSGEIEGITPLSLRCQSLDPHRQGLRGIGRLALLHKPHAFANRALLLVHIVSHTQDINPGLRFCWLCMTWMEGEPEHLDECRKRHFATQPRPLTFDAYTLQLRLPGAPRSEAFGTARLPFSNAQGAPQELRDWLRQLFASLVEQVEAGRSSPRKGKPALVRSIPYSCPVLECPKVMIGLTATLKHLAQVHRFPVLSRQGVTIFDGIKPDEKVHPHISFAQDDTLLRIKDHYCLVTDER